MTVLITEKQLAERWQCHPVSLRKDRQAREATGKGLPFLRIGSRIRYRLEDVEEHEREAVQ